MQYHKKISLKLHKKVTLRLIPQSARSKGSQSIPPGFNSCGGKLSFQKLLYFFQIFVLFHGRYFFKFLLYFSRNFHEKKFTKLFSWTYQENELIISQKCSFLSPTSFLRLTLASLLTFNGISYFDFGPQSSSNIAKIDGRL